MDNTFESYFYYSNIKEALSNIRYFKSRGNYVEILTKNKTQFLQITTKKLEDSLPKQKFLRIHKSYIINKDFINQYSDDYLLIDNLRIPIGKTYKQHVKYELFSVRSN